MLNVDRLIHGGQTLAKGESVPWYPRFGHVYYSRNAIQGSNKMYVILSDDAWNDANPWVIGIRLTSRSKPPRLRWEIPLSGGPAIVGDIFPLPKAMLDQRPPKAPRPVNTTAAERVALGRGLELLLGL